MTELAWSTAITSVSPNEVRVRGYNIAELMGNLSFGRAVYLLFRGEIPDENIGRLVDAILVASIDHGGSPPSVLAARTVSSTGGSLSAAVAAGILTVNRYHGGAIEDCARLLRQIVDTARDKGVPMSEVAEPIIREIQQRHDRVPGFGHRMHTQDPRTGRLFRLAEEAGVAGRHVEAARTVEQRLSQWGKKLCINVDGAAATVLCELGFDPELMNGFFMISRTAGLVAHVAEERRRERPMRPISPTAYRYDGPEPRSLR